MSGRRTRRAWVAPATSSAAAPPARVRDPAGLDRLDRALRGAPAGPCFALAQAGEAALHLWSCGREVSVHDVDLDGLALTALKAAAMLELKPPSRAALYGLDAAGRRLWFLHYLRPHLRPEHAGYWDARESLVRGGIADGGALERRLLRWAQLARRAPHPAAARWLLRLGLRGAEAVAPRLAAAALAEEGEAARWLRGERPALGLPSVEAAPGARGALRIAAPGPVIAALRPGADFALIDLGDALDALSGPAGAAWIAAAQAALHPAGRLCWWSRGPILEAPAGFSLIARGVEGAHPWAAAWAVAGPAGGPSAASRATGGGVGLQEGEDVG